MRTISTTSRQLAFVKMISQCERWLLTFLILRTWSVNLTIIYAKHVICLKNGHRIQQWYQWYSFFKHFILDTKSHTLPRYIAAVSLPCQTDILIICTGNSVSHSNLLQLAGPILRISFVHATIYSDCTCEFKGTVAWDFYSFFWL